MNESKTPLTDAVSEDLFQLGGLRHVVPTDFARQLEQENQELRESAIHNGNRADVLANRRDELLNIITNLQTAGDELTETLKEAWFVAGLGRTKCNVITNWQKLKEK
jgi:hypothetical protein